jgi:hypothetical protein
MKYTFFKTASYDAIETTTLFQKLHLDLEQSGAEKLIYGLAQNYVKRLKPIGENIDWNSAASLKEELNYLRERLYQFLKLKNNEKYISQLEKLFEEQVFRLSPPEAIPPLSKSKLEFQFFNRNNYDSIDTRTVFKNMYGIDITRLNLLEVLKKMALKHAYSLSTCGAGVGPFYLAARDSESFYMKLRLYSYYHVIDIPIIVEHLGKYYTVILENERNRLRALKEQSSAAQVLRQIKELKELRQRVAQEMAEIKEELEQEESKKTKTSSIQKNTSQSNIPKIMEVILYKSDNHRGGHFVESRLEYQKNELIFDYWYLNDRYEKEEWIYINQKNFKKLHNALVVSIQGQSINEDELPYVLIQKIKEQFNGKNCFSRFETFLSENKIEFLRQRRVDVNPNTKS